ncbi:4a-hydroxytetrahydrobiopterin dehydratase [Pustulibacterium marinum]|uniref:Putative pterin-4-alpha-carbinolamine dehydratase n=1 Tax=Pustulibacterium marinum TaxID=1224947 RepID=A0A1I7G2P5_9FLAO|nr:4a-hydroxytetrahydrobiopterin dehydratase [Pustulibacterium marinum]SFU42546.1 4a-hydroxytetrahydrobiopterin dehydratase [Pustulibacterium marinum]
MKKLNETEINTILQDLQGWHFIDNGLETSFEFPNFKDAFSAITRIAFEAERLQHHPDWSNSYNTLTIRLTTHDADGVTEKDVEFAKLIDELVA